MGSLKREDVRTTKVGWIFNKLLFVILQSEDFIHQNTMEEDNKLYGSEIILSSDVIKWVLNKSIKLYH